MNLAYHRQELQQQNHEVMWVMLNNNSSWQGFLLSSSMGAFPLLAWLRSGSSQGWWKINMLVDSEDITGGITYITYIVPWKMKAGGQEPVLEHMIHNQISGWSRWWARYFYQAVRMVGIVGNVIRGVSEKTIVCLPLFTNICVCAGFCLSTVCSFSGSVSKIAQVYIPQLEKILALPWSNVQTNSMCLNMNKLCRIQGNKVFILQYLQ